MRQILRKFEVNDAVREQVPVLAGLFGPSGSGKTFSALRLATGMKKAAGKGNIIMIDTESRRALHYADNFAFKHVPFEAPFSPLDYLKVMEDCMKLNPAVIIIDSMSHEHEGPGGVLEMHEEDMERFSGGDRAKAERVKFLAWVRPKQERRRLINSFLQMNCNLIFCFRAKEKLKLAKGKDPEPLGWQPIAGDEFLYEMTLNCMLPPNSGGVPQWHAEHKGEQALIKLPQQFRGLFLDSKPLDEEIGEKLAQWAAGGKVDTKSRSTAPKEKEKELESGNGKITTASIDRMLKKFESYNASREMIEAKLGHSVDKITLAEMKSLKTIHEKLEQGKSLKYVGLAD